MKKYTFNLGTLHMRLPYKLLLIMRLIIIIMTTCLMQLSASTLAQKVTLTAKNASLEALFGAIRTQTGYGFIYTSEVLKGAKTVNVELKNVTLNEALEQIFKNQSIDFELKGNTVVLKTAEPSFRDKVVGLFLGIEVRGRVVGENNQPLQGATVKIKGGANSTSTNANGEFSLQNVDEKAILVISFIGYNTKEIKASENLGNIQLIQSTDKLEEVEINAGYYTVKDRERTGSISRITGETISKQPVNNLLMALVGRVPGLQITQQTGVPGGGFKVEIRGRNSINPLVGNDPLYIIDGVTYPSTGISNGSTTLILGGEVSPLSLIDPSEIESIEVLKDADATAIYGSRGANGVILITTRKGKQGDFKINAAISQGIANVAKRVNLMNTDEYLQMRREAFRNDGLQPGVIDYDVNGTWSPTEYRDWQKELIGKNALTTNASLNINGGTEKSTYVIGASYYKEGTVFPGNFGFKRIGAHSNLSLGTAASRFNANFTASYSRSESNLFASDISQLIQLAPNQPNPFDEYGQLNWADNTVNSNPFARLLQTSNSETDNLLGNVTFNYSILRNLVLRASIGYNKIIRREFQKTPLASISPASSTYNSSSRRTFFGNNYLNNFLAEPILSYTTSFLEGKISGLVGMSFQNNRSQMGLISARDFTSDDLMENLGSAAAITNSVYQISQYRYIAVFARLNYSIADKYFLNLTARRDGSSRFGTGKQFANFGAVGAAWIFSDEKFIKENLSFLSFGKLRGSYGITGNDQIANYAYLQLWDTSTAYQNSSTLNPSYTAANADFAWETNQKLEGAIQLGFLEDKLSLEVSYYRNRSSNQLLRQSLPLSTGLSNVQRNLPAVVVNTGWEFDAKFQILTTKKLKWSAGLNFTRPKNELLSYPGLESSADANSFVLGAPLNILKAYNVTVDRQSGVYVFEDKNKNGARDNGDRYIPIFLGQEFYGGIQNSISYKQFALDFQFTFTRQKGKNYLSSANQSPGGMFSGGYSNQLIDVSGRWQNAGDESSIQKFSTTTTNSSLRSNAALFGNLFVVDASYIRLRNVSLIWSIPKNWLIPLKIENAAFKIQCQNVFTLTNYLGLDPEVQSFNLPPLRTLAFGFNVTF